MKIRLEDLSFYNYAKRMFKDLEGVEFDRLKEDLAKRGQQLPILVDESMMVLDGRQRVRAATELGWKEIWVNIMPSSKAEKQEIAVKANYLRRHLSKKDKIILLAEWYEPIREQNIEKKKENLKKRWKGKTKEANTNVGSLEKHDFTAFKEVNANAGSLEIRDPGFPIEVNADAGSKEVSAGAGSSATTTRENLKKLGASKGITFSTGEVDEATRVFLRAKEEKKTVAQVLAESPGNDNTKKTQWEKARERIAGDMDYRSRLFDLFRGCCIVELIDAYELPPRMKHKYNGKKKIWVIEL